MIRKLELNETGAATRWMWDLCSNSTGRSYPLFQSLEDIEAEYRSCVNEENSSLLGYYKDERLIGLLSYYYEPDELYLQTTSLAAAEDHNIVISAFLSYISDNYSGYEILIGVTAENIGVIDVLVTFGYKVVEASSDMRLNRSCFIRRNESDSIIERIDKEHFHEYSGFHKAHFDNIYWNTERLYDKADEWYIFVNKEAGKITGGLFMTVKENYAEIFGMAMNNILDKPGAVTLLSEAVNVVLGDNSYVNSVIFFVEEKDIINLYAAEECGFELRNSYRCYKEKIE